MRTSLPQPAFLRNLNAFFRSTHCCHSTADITAVVDVTTVNQQIHALRKYSVSRSKNQTCFTETAYQKVMCFGHEWQIFSSLFMTDVHFDTLHSVKIHPIFVAIHLKGSNYESRFYVLSL